VWPANAVLLAALLDRRPDGWGRLLAVGYLANVATADQDEAPDDGGRDQHVLAVQDGPQEAGGDPGLGGWGRLLAVGYLANVATGLAMRGVGPAPFLDGLCHPRVPPGHQRGDRRAAEPAERRGDQAADQDEAPDGA
jgi:hypothetical protein